MAERRLEKRISRRRFVRGAVLGAAALSVPGSLLVRGGDASSQTTDALQRLIRTELSTFTDWLGRNGVKGYIGEVGWPDNYRGDASKWNALAEVWYDAADAAKLWITQWSTGEWWGTTYKLALYEDRRSPAGVDSANAQAVVTEAHPTTPSYLRGVNVSGAYGHSYAEEVADARKRGY